jgi:membrane protein DedA with SNARE-associated domain
MVADMGYPGLFLLIVLESTLVPIPSFLVFPFAGYLAQQGVFSLPVILILNTVGAIAGSAMSYFIGVKGGKPFLLRFGKYFFVTAADIDRTEKFFHRFGARAILLGRFVPVVRHVQSIPAGIARMPLRKFLMYSGLGATIWGGGLMVLGYSLGSRWHDLSSNGEKFSKLIAVVIIGIVGLLIVRLLYQRRKIANVRKKIANASTKEEG